MSNSYGHNFYKDRHQKTVYSANTILSIVMDALPAVYSAVDFGCGVGTWLSVLKEKGVDEIMGLDGSWVKPEMLEISKNNFQQVNLDEEIKLDRRYDLAISLEVAEHLQPEVADRFIKSLANASDFVLFSAAIPFQGGKGHINEQWPDYWAALFEKMDYVALDFIRGKIWNEEEIPFWYRQNILLFAKQDAIQRLRISDLDAYNQNSPMNIVHPALYLSKSLKVDRATTIKGSLRFFRRAVKNWIKSKMGKTN